MDSFFPHRNSETDSADRNREWKISRIRGKSVGEILEETRLEQNITIETAAKDTGIHPNHLISMESGDYPKLPGGVYSEKILETYANFLNIDFESLKKIFDKETRTVRREQKQAFTAKISLKNFIVTPQIIKIVSILAVVAALLTYLGFEINNIFSPPPLSVSSPADNLITDRATVEIVGQTKSEVTVKINDQPVQTDANGNFRETVGLQPGLNVIKISATKKRSKENIIYRQIILNEL